MESFENSQVNTPHVSRSRRDSKKNVLLMYLHDFVIWLMVILFVFLLLYHHYVHN